MMQFNHVQKWYASHLALDIPSLSLDKGIYWLQGENGSGKTTFLKMIAGLHPFNGDILVSGISIKKHRVNFLRLVNYAEAEPLYPPFLTAKDMVELYCQTMKSDIESTRALLAQLHIIDSYQKPLGAWSSGMLKKLSLALAFTGNPSWILLDEPLITIDAEAIRLTEELINTWHDAKNISFIITSHQPFREHSLRITRKMFAGDQTISILHD